MKNLPELKSKPIIGVPEEEWSNWTMKKEVSRENLSMYATTDESKEKIRDKRKSNAAIPVTIYKIIEIIRAKNKIIDFVVEKIGDFPSVFEAGEELNTRPADLRLILNPNYPGSISANGYTVQRQDTELGGYKEKLLKRKEKAQIVIAYKDGKEVGKFRNGKQAAITLQLPITSVYGVLDPKLINKVQCKGYTFKYGKQ